ncbi:hypothetical protein [Methylocystis sp. SB2]|uniref:hypothetical protein n=1 Tax=Methylocystis sp. (strain SB2) TaxID=743836 RepID=UPI0012EDA29B|nr:hypothetical protein [Methylocystis sp. SB2]ULO24250.1 hypothetical protein LNB28_02230 [Methylocystis sp. SB2]
MSLAPTDAYEAAKNKREAQEKERIAKEARANEFMLFAEKRLEEIDSAVKASIPKGLQLDTIVTGAGGLDSGNRHGLKGLYLKLFEAEALVAEGAINIGSDECAVITDFTRNAHGRQPGVVFKTVPFAKLDVDLCTEFLSHLIKTHVS